jgi:hypothetical protein
LADEDEPGIIFIPKPWRAAGLEAGKQHTVRVRPIGPALPDLRFLLQCDPKAPHAQNDLLILETEDGSWRHELAVGQLSEVEPHYVEAIFPAPPMGALLNLLKDPKDDEEPFFVFRGVSARELMEARARQLADEEQPTADG